MELAATTELEQSVRSATTNGDQLLLVTSSNDGDVALRVFEPADSGSLEEVGSLTAPGSGYDPTAALASGIAIEDDIAYVALAGETENGIWAVDIADPENLEEQVFFETPGVAPVSIAVSDDLAAVGTGRIGSGVTFIDTSSPDALERLSAFEHTAVSTASVELSGDLTFFTDLSGVTLVDVSDASAPAEVGAYSDPDWSGPASSVGSSAATLTQTPGMTGGTPSIAVEGDYVYLVNGTSNLDILDVSDTANIEAVGGVETEQAAISVSIAGDFAYVLSLGELTRGMTIDDFPYLLQKVDISDPENPEVTEEITDLSGGFPSPSQSVVTGDELLYIVNLRSIEAVRIAE